MTLILPPCHAFLRCFVTKHPFGLLGEHQQQQWHSADVQVAARLIEGNDQARGGRHRDDAFMLVRTSQLLRIHRKHALKP